MARICHALAILIAICLFFVTPAVSLGEEPGESALKSLERRLKALLKTSCPDAIVELKTEELTIRYKTQKFMVHGSDRTGTYSKDLHEELGPNRGGFLLRLTLRASKYNGPLVIPQTRREPYWNTYLNEYDLKAERFGAVLWMSLSYSDAAPEKLLTSIKECVAAVSSNKAAAPSRCQRSQKN
jgi:hypothetical protein